MPTTTQQSISPIHITLTTPKKNTVFPQTTIQSTVKPSQMDYQTFRPVTTSRQTNKQKHQIEITFQIITIIFFKNPKQQNTPIRIVIINRNHKIKKQAPQSVFFSHELH